METKLLPVLLDMKQCGVKVNVQKAELVKKDFKSKEQKLLLDIKKETSIELEPWVSTSIAKIFEYYKIPFEKTDKTNKPSFTKAYLQACPHPIAAKILKVRELNKAQTTFIDSIINHAYKDRIHCEFHQLRSEDGGTVTGRFSSSNPNLQQIPARDPEIKKVIRGLFEPEFSEKWGSFDYSSQEPRLLVHYCASLNENEKHPLIDEVVQKYHEGDDDFHQMVADLAGITRTQAKTVNLGIMYGMGQGKLASTLDITVDEAKELLNQYHEKVPFVKGLANRISSHAQNFGRIRTILGRKCRFDLWEPCTFGYNRALPHEDAIKEYSPQKLKRAFTYKALNKLIQGSAADQTKKAMLDCYEKGHLPLLTVHDELCFSIHSQEQAKEITEIMETGLELKVPSKVDQELGDNWGEVG
jgi:DNA polymerase I-like protein with 3'-5' exonuclease and polymerase domains